MPRENHLRESEPVSDRPSPVPGEPGLDRRRAASPRRARPSCVPVALAGCVAAGACVTTGTYDKTVADLVKLRADDGRAAAQKNASMEAEAHVLEGPLKDANEHLAALVTVRAALRKELDDAAVLAGEFRSRLETLAQNVDKLTSEKGQLGHGLAEARMRLEDLRRQEAAAQARAATFRSLVVRLLVDNGMRPRALGGRGIRRGRSAVLQRLDRPSRAESAARHRASAEPRRTALDGQREGRLMTSRVSLARRDPPTDHSTTTLSHRHFGGSSAAYKRARARRGPLLMAGEIR